MAAKQARKRLGKALKQTIASERRRRLEQLLSVDEAVGHRRRALPGGADRRHLHHLRLRQRLLQGRAPDRRRQVPGVDPPRAPLMIRGPGITAGVQSDELSRRSTSRRRSRRSRRHDRPRRRRPLVPALRRAVAALDAAAAAGGHRAGPGQRGLRPPDRERLGGQDRQGQGRGPQGVKNLDQEKMATKTVANGNFAPAYRAVRTSRYLYVLYANGQSELYDLLLDPRPAALQARRPALPLRTQVLVRPTRRPLLQQCGCCRTEAGGPGAAAEEGASGSGKPSRSRSPSSLGLSGRGHWPNWIRPRPPKSVIPGSSPGCPAPTDDSFFRTTKR